MTDRERFLRAIEADFNNDVPRLAFADWLDEQGEPERAEFIRYQIEAYRLRWREDDPGRAAPITAAADGLLARHRAAWTAGLPKWARGREFERGFQKHSTLTAHRLVNYGAVIRAVGPLGDYLRVLRVRGREAELFACPHLEAVTHLSFIDSGLTDAGAAAIAAGRHLGRVQAVSVVRYGSRRDPNRLGDTGAAAIASAGNLPALTFLCLDGQPRLTAAGVRAIATSSHRAGLTDLLVGRSPGGPSMADAFRGPGTRLDRLNRLELSHLRLGDAGAERLADAPAFAQLSWLELYANDLSDAGAAAVLRSPHFGRLRVLSFAGNPLVTDVTARAILADDRGWERVDLHNTGVTPALATAVAARFRWRN